MEHHCEAPSGCGAEDTVAVSPQPELFLPDGGLGGQTLSKRMLYAANNIRAAPDSGILGVLNF